MFNLPELTVQVIEQKMAAERVEESNVEVEFPKFLGEVENRTETIFENFDTEAAETQAKVLDQTISVLRSMKECCNLDTRDKENPNSIAGVLVDVLSVLRRRTITPSTVCGCAFNYDRYGKRKKFRKTISQN